MPLHADPFRIHEQGKVFSGPTTQHSKAQQQGALLHLPQHFQAVPRVPSSKRLEERNTETGRVLARLLEHIRKWQNHKSMHLAQACRNSKANKWKSTSEVTLQDSNLEVYWQRGKRAGLVHSRDTLAQHPPPAGNRCHAGGGRAGTEHREAITHTCHTRFI